MRVRFMRRGGLRFLSAGRLSVSWSLRRPEPRPPSRGLPPVMFWGFLAPGAFLAGAFLPAMF